MFGWILGLLFGGSILWATVPKAKTKRRWGQPWWARKRSNAPKVDPVTGQEIPRKPKPGKELEVVFGETCRKLTPRAPGFPAYWNSNSTHPVCDARLTFFGISVVAECKECSEERYGFRRMSDKERKNLEWNERAGGLSVVFILHRRALNPDGLAGGLRLYALSWLNWKQLEKRGEEIKRTTFPLTDSERPGALRPIALRIDEDGTFEIDEGALYAFLVQCIAHYLDWNLKKITGEVPNAA